ncbi:MAG TPA: phage minor head protein [Nocardioides sp.]|uniref:phage minor head protein n=1 Tax=Nocardioides sp. TaxID=35761 RepID=UPI002ED86E62
MAVTTETLRLQAEIRANLDRIVDNQTRDLVAAWADAWDEVSPDLTAALLEQLVAGETITRAQLLRSTRLRKALQVIKAQLETLATDAGVRIVADLQDVIDTAGAAQASVIDSQLPPNADQLVDLDAWSRVDADQVAAIVTRTTEQITSLARPIPAEQYAILRRELIRGMAAGSNPRATAARIMRRTEGRFNGGLTRALVISRTETLDAHRAAARLGRLAHADVLGGWTWLAKLDARTCPSCWAQHGSLHDVDELGPQDHQQGRCTAVPTTKSWKDLGIDIEEPPSLLPDAAHQFATLSPAEQKQILGPARYAAWVRGEFLMNAWSVRRTTDGWRDSYGVAPAPGASRGGRRSRKAA